LLFVLKRLNLKLVKNITEAIMKINLFRQAACIIALTLLSITMSVNAQDTESVSREKATTIVHEGDIAPDFTVEMLDGRKIKLSDLRGKIVLLNFWATWCGPCMMEFNEIPEQIIKHFEGKDVVLLAISRGEKPEVVATKMAALKAKGIVFPVGLDPERKIYSQYAKEFIPRNFIIDKKGKVNYVTVGYTETGIKELVSRIDGLLK